MKKPKSSRQVLLFCIEQLAFLDRAWPAFGLPDAWRTIPCLAFHGRQHSRSKLFDRHPAPAVDPDQDELFGETLLWVVGERFETIQYHPGATHDAVRASLVADGFEVLSVDALVAAASTPRDPKASRTRWKKHARAVAKVLPPAEVDAATAYVCDGGALPAVSHAVATTLAVLALDEAIETWGPLEDRAFALAASVNAQVSFGGARVPEPFGVDRVGLLVARLAAQGVAPRDIDVLLLQGDHGRLGGASSSAYELEALTRITDLVTQVLAARDADPRWALRALLSYAGEELPEPLHRRARELVAAWIRDDAAARTVPTTVIEEFFADDRRGFKKAVKALGAGGDATWGAVPVASAPRLDAANAAYGVAFPAEVVALYDVAKALNPEAPLRAFAGLPDLDLTLVGPFEYLDGTPRVKKGLDARLHLRGRFDAPEFFTVVTGETLQLGYWFDDPSAGPSCVVTPIAAVEGRTLTEALRRVLERGYYDATERHRDGDDDAPAALAGLARVRDALRAVGTGERHEFGALYSQKYDLCAWRAARCVPGTWDDDVGRIGVVGGRDATRVELPTLDALEKPAARKKALAAALARAAKGDGVSALALGRELWGMNHTDDAVAALDAAYAAMGRPALREVLRLHVARGDGGDDRPRALV